jgi:uncharacterized protein involved in type VI secretion and phage assembly
VDAVVLAVEAAAAVKSTRADLKRPTAAAEAAVKSTDQAAMLEADPELYLHPATYRNPEHALNIK